MSKKKLLKIPIDTELERFGRHMEHPDNKRIMFSAGFGAGKSFFLNEFFSSQDKVYHSINLYPVDYSVSSNEDIFEIIKFDILDAMLKAFPDEIKLSEEDISQVLITQEFLRNEVNFYKVFKIFAKHFIPFGETVTDSVDVLKEVFDSHNTFSGEMKQKGSETAGEFIKMFRNKTGSIREMDGTTLLIRDFINRIKKEIDKPVVLIIDDMDRLDPEHIFRIFNVFTAHHDSRNERNKFGFDKVIFVSDVNNIEHMFYHRFGTKAEFSGYIDKFYSCEIFQFRHNDYLKQLFHDTYVRPRLNLEQQNEIPKNYVQMLDKGYKFQKVFIKLVSEMIDIDAVRIRNLVKFSSYELPEHVFRFNEIKAHAFSYPLLSLIHLLRQLFPRLEDLDRTIKTLVDNYHADYSMMPTGFDDGGFGKELIHYSLPFIDPYAAFNYNITAGDKQMNVLNEHGRGYVVRYRLSENFEYGGGKLEYLSMHDPSEAGHAGLVYKPNVYHFLLNAFRFCWQHSLLH